jgi:hypothetical protein
MATAHQANQKITSGKYSAVVRPSDSRPGLPFHSEKKATDMAIAATDATCQTRYFHIWPVCLANWSTRSFLLPNVLRFSPTFAFGYGGQGAAAHHRTRRL